MGQLRPAVGILLVLPGGDYDNKRRDSCSTAESHLGRHLRGDLGIGAVALAGRAVIFRARICFEQIYSCIILVIISHHTINNLVSSWLWRLAVSLEAKSLPGFLGDDRYVP